MHLIKGSKHSMLAAIAAMVVVVAVLVLLSGTAFAAENEVSVASDKASEIIIDGDLTIEEGASPHTPSAVEKAAEANKTKEATDFANKLQKEFATTKAASTSVTLKMVAYKQEYTYYCGPATVKEVVQYFKGTSSSQAFYATKLGTISAGTVMTNIPGVLRTYTGKNYIYSEGITSVSTWQAWLLLDITHQSYKWPVVLDIATTKDFWPYKTSGHYVAVSGLVYTGSTVNNVYICDCHPSYTNAYYNATRDKAFKANVSHWRKAMVW